LPLITTVNSGQASTIADAVTANQSHWSEHYWKMLFTTSATSYVFPKFSNILHLYELLAEPL